MQKPIRGILFYFAVCLSISRLVDSPIYAQSSSEVCLHLDKSFYVAGEVAWFTLYLPSKYRDREIAINTTLVDGNGKQRDRFFLRNGGKTMVPGYYKFPYEVSAGIFEIQFRVTKGGSIPDEVMASFPIPVYNDLANLSNVSMAPISSPEDELVDGNFNIEISMPSESKRRAKVPVKIKVMDQANQPVLGGSISVSVTDSELCGTRITDYPALQISESAVDGVGELKNYIYIQGRLGTVENPQQVNVLGGYIGVDDKIYYSKSFDDGFFSMKLPDFTGPKMIQFIGYQFEQPEISASVDLATTIHDHDPIKYNEGILEYLKYSRMRKKVFQYFEQEEMPLNLPTIRYEVDESKPDMSFNIKEYESFPDMKGFFGEIITTLTFKLGDDSIYTASLYNPKERRSKNTNLKGPPLFIVDGKMTRNAHFIANMSMVPIQRVEIYTNAEDRRDKYSAIGISGIVKIKTTLQDVPIDPADAEDVHTSYGLQQPASFPALNPDHHQTQPLFRPQVYWNAAIPLNTEGEATFDFTQSDDLGNFVIEVVFQSKEGKLSRARTKYNVKL